MDWNFHTAVFLISLLSIQFANGTQEACTDSKDSSCELFQVKKSDSSSTESYKSSTSTHDARAQLRHQQEQDILQRVEELSGTSISPSGQTETVLSVRVDPVKSPVEVVKRINNVSEDLFLNVPGVHKNRVDEDDGILYFNADIEKNPDGTNTLVERVYEIMGHLRSAVKAALPDILSENNTETSSSAATETTEISKQELKTTSRVKSTVTSVDSSTVNKQDRTGEITQADTSTESNSRTTTAVVAKKVDHGQLNVVLPGLDVSSKPNREQTQSRTSSQKTTTQRNYTATSELHETKTETTTLNNTSIESEPSVPIKTPPPIDLFSHSAIPSPAALSGHVHPLLTNVPYKANTYPIHQPDVSTETPVSHYPNNRFTFTPHNYGKFESREITPGEQPKEEPEAEIPSTAKLLGHPISYNSPQSKNYPAITIGTKNDSERESTNAAQTAPKNYLKPGSTASPEALKESTEEQESKETTSLPKSQSMSPKITTSQTTSTHKSLNHTEEQTYESTITSKTTTTSKTENLGPKPTASPQREQPVKDLSSNSGEITKDVEQPEQSTGASSDAPGTLHLYTSPLHYPYNLQTFAPNDESNENEENIKKPQAASLHGHLPVLSTNVPHGNENTDISKPQYSVVGHLHPLLPEISYKPISYAPYEPTNLNYGLEDSTENTKQSNKPANSALPKTSGSYLDLHPYGSPAAHHLYNFQTATPNIDNPSVQASNEGASEGSNENKRTSEYPGSLHANLHSPFNPISYEPYKPSTLNRNNDDSAEYTKQSKEEESTNASPKTPESYLGVHLPNHHSFDLPTLVPKNEPQSTEVSKEDGVSSGLPFAGNLHGHINPHLNEVSIKPITHVTYPASTFKPNSEESVEYSTHPLGYLPTHNPYHLQTIVPNNDNSKEGSLSSELPSIDWLHGHVHPLLTNQPSTKQPKLDVKPTNSEQSAEQSIESSSPIAPGLHEYMHPHGRLLTQPPAAPIDDTTRIYTPVSYKKATEASNEEGSSSETPLFGNVHAHLNPILTTVPDKPIDYSPYKPHNFMLNLEHSLENTDKSAEESTNTSPKSPDSYLGFHPHDNPFTHGVYPLPTLVPKDDDEKGISFEIPSIESPAGDLHSILTVKPNKVTSFVPYHASNSMDIWDHSSENTKEPEDHSTVVSPKAPGLYSNVYPHDGFFTHSPHIFETIGSNDDETRTYKPTSVKENTQSSNEDEHSSNIPAVSTLSGHLHPLLTDTPYKPISYEPYKATPFISQLDQSPENKEQSEEQASVASPKHPYDDAFTKGLFDWKTSTDDQKIIHKTLQNVQASTGVNDQAQSSETPSAAGLYGHFHPLLTEAPHKSLSYEPSNPSTLNFKLDFSSESTEKSEEKTTKASPTVSGGKQSPDDSHVSPFTYNPSYLQSLLPNDEGAGEAKNSNEEEKSSETPSLGILHSHLNPSFTNVPKQPISYAPLKTSPWIYNMDESPTSTEQSKEQVNAVSPTGSERHSSLHPHEDGVSSEIPPVATLHEHFHPLITEKPYKPLTFEPYHSSTLNLKLDTSSENTENSDDKTSNVSPALPIGHLDHYTHGSPLTYHPTIHHSLVPHVEPTSVYKPVVYAPADNSEEEGITTEMPSLGGLHEHMHPFVTDLPKHPSIKTPFKPSTLIDHLDASPESTQQSEEQSVASPKSSHPASYPALHPHGGFFTDAPGNADRSDLDDDHTRRYKPIVPAGTTAGPKDKEGSSETPSTIPLHGHYHPILTDAPYKPVNSYPYHPSTISSTLDISSESPENSEEKTTSPQPIVPVSYLNHYTHDYPTYGPNHLHFSVPNIEASTSDQPNSQAGSVEMSNEVHPSFTAISNPPISYAPSKASPWIHHLDFSPETEQSDDHSSAVSTPDYKVDASEKADAELSSELPSAATLNMNFHPLLSQVTYKPLKIEPYHPSTQNAKLDISSENTENFDEKPTNASPIDFSLGHYLHGSTYKPNSHATQAANSDEEGISTEVPSFGGLHGSLHPFFTDITKEPLSNVPVKASTRIYHLDDKPGSNEHSEEQLSVASSKRPESLLGLYPHDGLFTKNPHHADSSRENDDHTTISKPIVFTGPSAETNEDEFSPAAQLHEHLHPLLSVVPHKPDHPSTLNYNSDSSSENTEKSDVQATTALPKLPVYHLDHYMHGSPLTDGPSYLHSLLSNDDAKNIYSIKAEADAAKNSDEEETSADLPSFASLHGHTHPFMMDLPKNPVTTLHSKLDVSSENTEKSAEQPTITSPILPVSHLGHHPYGSPFSFGPNYLHSLVPNNEASTIFQPISHADKQASASEEEKSFEFPSAGNLHGQLHPIFTNEPKQPLSYAPSKASTSFNYLDDSQESIEQSKEKISVVSPKGTGSYPTLYPHGSLLTHTPVYKEISAPNDDYTGIHYPKMYTDLTEGGKDETQSSENPPIATLHGHFHSPLTEVPYKPLSIEPYHPKFDVSSDTTEKPEEQATSALPKVPVTYFDHYTHDRPVTYSQSLLPKDVAISSYQPNSHAGRTENSDEEGRSSEVPSLGELHGQFHPFTTDLPKQLLTHVPYKASTLIHHFDETPESSEKSDEPIKFGTPQGPGSYLGLHPHEAILTNKPHYPDSSAPHEAFTEMYKPKEFGRPTTDVKDDGFSFKIPSAATLQGPPHPLFTEVPYKPLSYEPHHPSTLNYKLDMSSESTENSEEKTTITAPIVSLSNLGHYPHSSPFTYGPGHLNSLAPNDYTSDSYKPISYTGAIKQASDEEKSSEMPSIGSLPGLLHPFLTDLPKQSNTNAPFKSSPMIHHITDNPESNKKSDEHFTVASPQIPESHFGLYPHLSSNGPLNAASSGPKYDYTNIYNPIVYGGATPDDKDEGTSSENPAAATLYGHFHPYQPSTLMSKSDVSSEHTENPEKETSTSPIVPVSLLGHYPHGSPFTHSPNNLHALVANDKGTTFFEPMSHGASAEDSDELGITSKVPTLGGLHGHPLFTDIPKPSSYTPYKASTILHNWDVSPDSAEQSRNQFDVAASKSPGSHLDLYPHASFYTNAPLHAESLTPHDANTRIYKPILNADASASAKDEALSSEVPSTTTVYGHVHPLLTVLPYKPLSYEPYHPSTLNSKLDFSSENTDKPEEQPTFTSPIVGHLSSPHGSPVTFGPNHLQSLVPNHATLSSYKPIFHAVMEESSPEEKSFEIPSGVVHPLFTDVSKHPISYAPFKLATPLIHNLGESRESTEQSVEPISFASPKGIYPHGFLTNSPHNAVSSIPNEDHTRMYKPIAYPDTTDEGPTASSAAILHGHFNPDLPEVSSKPHKYEPYHPSTFNIKLESSSENTENSEEHSTTLAPPIVPLGHLAHYSHGAPLTYTPNHVNPNLDHTVFQPISPAEADKNSNEEEKSSEMPSYGSPHGLLHPFVTDVYKEPISFAPFEAHTFIHQLDDSSEKPEQSEEGSPNYLGLHPHNSFFTSSPQIAETSPNNKYKPILSTGATEEEKEVDFSSKTPSAPTLQGNFHPLLTEVPYKPLTYAPYHPSTLKSKLDISSESTDNSEEKTTNISPVGPVGHLDHYTHGSPLIYHPNNLHSVVPSDDFTGIYKPISHAPPAENFDEEPKRTETPSLADLHGPLHPFFTDRTIQPTSNAPIKGSTLIHHLDYSSESSEHSKESIRLSSPKDVGSHLGIYPHDAYFTNSPHYIGSSPSIDASTRINKPKVYTGVVGDNQDEGLSSQLPSSASLLGHFHPLLAEVPDKPHGFATYYPSSLNSKLDVSSDKSEESDERSTIVPGHLSIYPHTSSSPKYLHSFNPNEEVTKMYQPISHASATDSSNEDGNNAEDVSKEQTSTPVYKPITFGHHFEYSPDSTAPPEKQLSIASSKGPESDLRLHPHDNFFTIVPHHAESLGPNYDHTQLYKPILNAAASPGTKNEESSSEITSAHKPISYAPYYHGSPSTKFDLSSDNTDKSDEEVNTASPIVPGGYLKIHPQDSPFTYHPYNLETSVRNEAHGELYKPTSNPAPIDDSSEKGISSDVSSIGLRGHLYPVITDVPKHLGSFGPHKASTLSQYLDESPEGTAKSEEESMSPKSTGNYLGIHPNDKIFTQGPYKTDTSGPDDERTSKATASGESGEKTEEQSTIASPNKYLGHLISSPISYAPYHLQSSVPNAAITKMYQPISSAEPSENSSEQKESSETPSASQPQYFHTDVPKYPISYAPYKPSTLIHHLEASPESTAQSEEQSASTKGIYHGLYNTESSASNDDNTKMYKPITFGGSTIDANTDEQTTETSTSSRYADKRSKSVSYQFSTENSKKDSYEITDNSGETSTIASSFVPTRYLTYNPHGSSTFNNIESSENSNTEEASSVGNVHGNLHPLLTEQPKLPYHFASYKPSYEPYHPSTLKSKLDISSENTDNSEEKTTYVSPIVPVGHLGQYTHGDPLIYHPTSLHSFVPSDDFTGIYKPISKAPPAENVHSLLTNVPYKPISYTQSQTENTKDESKEQSTIGSDFGLHSYGHPLTALPYHLQSFGLDNDKDQGISPAIKSTGSLHRQVHSVLPDVSYKPFTYTPIQLHALNSKFEDSTEQPFLSSSIPHLTAGLIHHPSPLPHVDHTRLFTPILNVGLPEHSTTKPLHTGIISAANPHGVVHPILTHEPYRPISYTPYQLSTPIPKFDYKPEITEQKQSTMASPIGLDSYLGVHPLTHHPANLKIDTGLYKPSSYLGAEGQNSQGSSTESVHEILHPAFTKVPYKPISYPAYTPSIFDLDASNENTKQPEEQSSPPSHNAPGSYLGLHSYGSPLPKALTEPDNVDHSKLWSSMLTAGVPEESAKEVTQADLPFAAHLHGYLPPISTDVPYQPISYTPNRFNSHSFGYDRSDEQNYSTNKASSVEENKMEQLTTSKVNRYSKVSKSTSSSSTSVTNSETTNSGTSAESSGDENVELSTLGAIMSTIKPSHVPPTSANTASTTVTTPLPNVVGGWLNMSGAWWEKDNSRNLTEMHQIDLNMRAKNGSHKFDEEHDGPIVQRLRSFGKGDFGLNWQPNENLLQNMDGPAAERILRNVLTEVQPLEVTPAVAATMAYSKSPHIKYKCPPGFKLINRLCIEIIVERAQPVFVDNPIPHGWH